MTDSSARELAALLEMLQGLKLLKRTGWVDRGVPLAEVESVADHTLLTALLAWLAALDHPGLDATRVLKLAVVHDLAESLVGDAPPYAAADVPPATDHDAFRAFFGERHVRPTEAKRAKHEAETSAFGLLASRMGPNARRELTALWDEYEHGETAEAHFVKEADTLEAYLQSRHYAAAHPEIPLRGFCLMADEELELSTFTALRDAARKGETSEPGSDS